LPTQNLERLEAIHSMLAAGHRSVHLEKHSFFLWGLLGGVLCAGTQSVVNTERFPDFHQQALALITWLGFWLTSGGLLDYFLTKRAKRGRDETLPFAQAQMTRAWWMLLCMGTLSSFAMYFYGGGTMIYVLWIVLLGLGLYLFGLFSQPLIEWTGLAIILLGIVAPATGLPFGMTRWLAASCYAIGLPLTGWLASRVDDTRLIPRGLTLVGWLVVVVEIPVFLAKTLLTTVAPTTLPIPLSNFHTAVGEQVVNIPVGTPVSLRLSLDSSLLAVPADASFPMTLTRPLDMALKNGKPEGRYRLDGGKWADIHEGLLMVRIEKLQPEIESGMAIIRAQGTFDSRIQKNSEQ